MIQEKPISSLPGILMLFIVTLIIPLAWIGGVVSFAVAVKTDANVIAIGLALVLVFTLIGWFILLFGFYKVEPNQSAVLTLFGRYVGTNRRPGLHLNNPFYIKKKISLRVRNFESGRLKVNDLNGSPIEIAAIVVWEVNDSAEAVFNVDEYESFVHIQSEAAIRSMSSVYPYEAHEEGEASLRSTPMEISEKMRSEIQDRLAKAGLHVIEARISHLAYSPEIAQAMLQRQQAEAIIAARQRIVEGAVGMVEQALTSLKEKGLVDLDDERRAAMVSNLLVVLCSDQATQPVVNTGSIY